MSSAFPAAQPDAGAVADPLANRGWTVADAAAIPLPARTHAREGVGFAIHTAELINHYRGIWEHLDPGLFEIILAAEGAAENARVAAFARANGYRQAFVGDLLAAGDIYDAVVSNHAGSAGQINAAGHFALPRLGTRQIRLMYALGKARANFADWNELYDLILCWGPYHAANLARFSNPRLAEVGYPRFDRFFDLTADRAAIVRQLGGDPDRRTIAWLPTWSSLSSIDAFAGVIGRLREVANVIVKVHPLTASSEPQRMQLLAEHGIEPVADPNFDNVALFRVADVVLADYGGSAFGAIYTDRDLVLLNVAGAAQDSLTGADSLDVRIREWIVSVAPDEPELLAAYLDDPSVRQDQQPVRDRLRRELFAPYEGVASEVAALAIRSALDRKVVAR